MKKVLLFLFSIISVCAVFAQSQPAPKTGGVALRVNDSTSYISSQTAAHSQGYADIFWNNQASTPHYDIWNGSSYDHVFTFGGGGSGTQDLQSVLDQGSSANIGDAQADLTAQDGSNYSQWSVTPSGVSLANSNNANTEAASLDITPSGVGITDTRVNRGIQGAADYSANIQANDYTQKVYVDAKIANSITNGVTTSAPNQDQVFDALALKAPLASPALTGSPTAPTQSANTNNTTIATTAYVDTGLALKAALHPTTRTVTGSTTGVIGDAGNYVEVNSASGTNFTVPLASSVDYSDNAILTVRNYGSGTVTINGSVTFRQQTGSGLTIPQFGVAQLVNKTADEWYVFNGTENTAEEVNNSVSTYTNYTTTATYQNITSIVLTTGEWDISAMFTFSSNSATITTSANAIFVISTTTASASGSTEGKNIAYVPQAALLGTSLLSGSIPTYRVSVSGTVTYYLNTQATFTVGNPQFVGSIRAKRAR